MGNKTSAPQASSLATSSASTTLTTFKWIFNEKAINDNKEYINSYKKYVTATEHIPVDGPSTYKIISNYAKPHSEIANKIRADPNNYYIGILNNNGTYVKFANTYEEALDKINKYNEIKQIGVSRNFTANNLPKEPSISGGGKRKQNKTKRNYRK